MWVEVSAPLREKFRIIHQSHPSQDFVPSPSSRRWEWMTRGELSEAIPPAYSEFLGRQVIKLLAPGAGVK